MRSFIERVTRRLGVEEATARAAAVGLLGFVRERAEAREFGDLLCSMPGSADLMGELPPEPPVGRMTRRGGLWDTMAGKALTAVGADGLSSGMELTGRLEDLGLTGHQAGTFITMFGRYAKEKAGNGLFWRIAGQVPEIRRPVGRSSSMGIFERWNPKGGESDGLQDR